MLLHSMDWQTRNSRSLPTRRCGELTYKKNVYFFNSETNDFTLISTEPNEDIIENFINPIDTLAATGKFAGDCRFPRAH